MALTDAGTVSILGGMINSTTGDGIHSSDTNLTVTGVTIGGTGTITGDGIEIANSGGLTHTVSLNNNTITANASGISTRDSGTIAGELLLTLDGNTLRATNSGMLGLDISGGELKPRLR